MLSYSIYEEGEKSRKDPIIEYLDRIDEYLLSLFFCKYPIEITLFLHQLSKNKQTRGNLFLILKCCFKHVLYRWKGTVNKPCISCYYTALSKLFLAWSKFGKPEMIDQYDVIARTVCRVLTKTILRII
jgi:hypothetical protein